MHGRNVPPLGGGERELTMQYEGKTLRIRYRNVSVERANEWDTLPLMEAAKEMFYAALIAWDLDDGTGMRLVRRADIETIDPEFADSLWAELALTMDAESAKEERGRGHSAATNGS